ncbi:ribosome-associated translation inhibitor RaiA [Desulfocurvibacter africanus]|jgi:putative sigma-54 modulation protein|uniref:Ribosome hibernation promoting factor n=2 Tax=Desulfocurvibacter africanus TaxID=873 RepID=F3Z3C5_DESAF|nr:ribosome-associated translation inhibitor RaiA [Desulfocurvibacter africanus]EGJ51465.1 sigma 54 modulation protein/ribosomal protein S30EA [Desulfocurvibacter africanus subsp. africanus str. Walvis Bay]EMG38704.1 ribosomal subunit interface protein [Desulfocurvibacter africanus PCS]
MNIHFTFKNFEPSEHLKNYARTRFGKLSKHGINSAELQVNMSVEKHRHMAEVVLSGDSLHLSANEESQDMYATIDMVLDKLVAQVKKSGDKKSLRKKPGQTSVRLDVFSYAQAGDRKERTIIQTDSYIPKPMDVDEAAMQLESLGYEFLVFHNAETERVNVIYQRKDGNYGLIDPGI